MIRENPYLQYFLGLPSFTNETPFDASTMTWFRKRLSPEMIAEVNDYIIGRKSLNEPDPPNNGSDDGDNSGISPDDKNNSQQEPQSDDY